MELNYGDCKITYLFNSGFLVETKNSLLLIDYYKSNHDLNLEKYRSKKMYILVSHDHEDHFNPDIFTFKNLSNPTYILDESIKYKSKYETIRVSKDNDYYINDTFSLKTFSSTDRGVSFFISIEGINIFHSGDLNWWKWKEDSVKQQEQEEKDYKIEIDKIKDFSFDISFVPVDPRLGEAYDLAVKYFAKKINTRVIIPMHYRSNVKPVETLKNNWEYLDFSSKFVFLKESGESFFYKKIE